MDFLCIRVLLHGYWRAYMGLSHALFKRCISRVRSSYLRRAFVRGCKVSWPRPATFLSYLLVRRGLFSVRWGPFPDQASVAFFQSISPAKTSPSRMSLSQQLCRIWTPTHLGSGFTWHLWSWSLSLYTRGSTDWIGICTRAATVNAMPSTQLRCTPS